MICIEELNISYVRMQLALHRVTMSATSSGEFSKLLDTVAHYDPYLEVSITDSSIYESMNRKVSVCILERDYAEFVSLLTLSFKLSNDSLNFTN